MITGINYNLLTVNNVKMFIEVLAYLDKSSFYEDHLQEILLSSIRFTEKLVLVLSYIINPGLYFTKVESKEDLLTYMTQKYECYKHIEKNKHHDEFNSDHNEGFLINLDSLIAMDPQLRIFINKEYLSKSTNAKKKHESICYNNLGTSDYHINLVNHIESLCNDNAIYYTSRQLEDLNDLFDSNKQTQLLETKPHYTTLLKVLMDVAKISHTIDKKILKTKHNITMMKNKEQPFVDNIKNLSRINEEEITMSLVYKTFSEKYDLFDFSNNNVKDSVMSLPSFPYYIDNVIYLDGRFANIVLFKQKYEGNKIMTMPFLNKVIYLRQQYNSLVIADSK
jgi:hypothetical protein